MRFYPTTHKRHWVKLTDVPLFLKSEHFASAAKLHPALGRYAVDSGGFSELQRHGEWTRTPQQYIADLRRIWECVGPYDWAAPQDWMCEDLIIRGGTAGPNVFVGTHLSVEEHQRRTVANFLELRSLAPDLRIIPVLQGRTIPEYERCVALYERAGVNLHREPTVGLGSVCRLQSTRQGAAIVIAMAAHGLRLHGFGFKILGLERVGHLLASADSAAWSSHARYRPALPGHTHKNCANCIDYALNWRARVLTAIPTHHQTLLTDRSAA
ncbi:deazapurine DNA modification protein DpdA family protein [Streptomyces sp. NPDC003631]